jgi:hypothetical protein
MPAERPFLSLVIPAYNEAARLPATLPAALAFVEAQPYAATTAPTRRARSPSA